MTVFLCADNQDWEKRETFGHKNELEEAHRMGERESDTEARTIKL